MSGCGEGAGRQGGFALVLTLGLVALLVLLVLALAGLSRVDGQIAATSVYQTQARQNALLGLGVALGRLQELAGPDERVTGMAGVTGIPAGATNATRHWCGAWLESGAFAGWLVSGAQGNAAALEGGVTPIELMGANAVGAATANSEHVTAGLVPLLTSHLSGEGASSVLTGNFAYAVEDEGVKIPALSPGPLPVVAPEIFPAPGVQTKLRDALANNATAAAKATSYAQLALIPLPGAPLTPSVLQDNLHHVTLASRFVQEGILTSGMINVNTNSVAVWRGILQTFNAVPGIAAPLPTATLSARGTTAQNGVTAFVTPGKNAHGPFTSVTAVTAFLGALFPTGTPGGAEIAAALQPMLAVRSDTFRIRAYGEAVNPASESGAPQVEARAFCEAIVQRVPELLDPARPEFGRRFVVTYFRWLGSDDI